MHLANLGRQVQQDLLHHLSPVGWQHINLTGDYLWTDPDAPSTAAMPALTLLLAPHFPAGQLPLVPSLRSMACRPNFRYSPRACWPSGSSAPIATSWLEASWAPWAVPVIGLAILASTLIPGFPEHRMYGLLFAALLIAVANAPGPLLVNPLTCFFGWISYSAYLLHFLALKLVTDAQGASVWPPLTLMALMFGAGLALTAASAWLTCKAIELPGLRLGRRVAKALIGTVNVACCRFGRHRLKLMPPAVRTQWG